MNLPLILDIALGLILIYLTLSLLAAEVQELIATVLQWRAEHLKKSIEILLSGKVGETLAEHQFTSELYRDPLIRSLNQEAKGPIAEFFRGLSAKAGDLYHAVTGTQNVFDEQRSGPSYIPSGAFAVALLQKLGIEELSLQISEATVKRFGEEKLDAIEVILKALRNSVGDDSVLRTEFEILQNCLKTSMDDVIQGRLPSSGYVEHVSHQCVQFISNTEGLLSPDNHREKIILGRLPYLKQTIAIRNLEPTITEVLSIVLDGSNHQKLPPELHGLADQAHKRSLEIPQQLRLNLIALAKQAQVQSQSLEGGVRQFQHEIEIWFERSMDRATGVYRRNSKGVALIIGFLLAVTVNADTLHMVNRLSRDTTLRSTIVQSAEQITLRSPPAGIEPATGSPVPAATIQTEIEAARNAVDSALAGIPLPLGWSQVNVQQQQAASQGWPFPILSQVAGWILTGVAIAMGASFWFDLLNKVVKIRNTGKPAETHANQD